MRDARTQDLSSIRHRPCAGRAIRGCGMAWIAHLRTTGRRLSCAHPRLRGLALPGMPPGAPGMRESTGSRAAFSTLAIARDGHARTYRCMPKYSERGLIPVKCAPAMF
jgi:hypothetical protein